MLVNSTPRLAPSSLSCTPSTPTLSAAFAETGVLPETTCPATGAVRETEGAVVSRVGKVRSGETARLPAGSRDLTR